METQIGIQLFYMLQCPKLVKKTWMIVVSLESGANIAEICNEINTCHSKKSQPKKKTSIFEHALMFCAVWRGNQPDAMKSVSGIIALHLKRKSMLFDVIFGV